MDSIIGRFVKVSWSSSGVSSGPSVLSGEERTLGFHGSGELKGIRAPEPLKRRDISRMPK